MRIEDESVLDQFRGRMCEWCGKERGHPHHIWAKGMGGGGTLDVRINLMTLCISHHDDVHNGKIRRWELLELVAKRERTTPEAIVDEINRLRRTRK